MQLGAGETREEGATAKYDMKQGIPRLGGNFSGNQKDNSNVSQACIYTVKLEYEPKMMVHFHNTKSMSWDKSARALPKKYVNLARQDPGKGN